MLVFAALKITVSKTGCAKHSCQKSLECQRISDKVRSLEAGCAFRAISRISLPDLRTAGNQRRSIEPTMIWPEIRRISSPDLEPPNLPKNPADCEILFQLFVGPKDDEGEEAVSFTVMTAARLAKDS